MQIYKLDYDRKAEIGINKFKKAGDISILKKLDILLKELEIHPRTGTGKPERLKGYGEQDVWSRRITDKHRLIYEIQDDVVIVLVLAAFGHYDDK